MHSLFKNINAKRIRVDGVNWEMAAGTGDVLSSDAVDTANSQGCAFEFVFGAIAATGTAVCKLQHSADGATGWTDEPNVTFTQTAAMTLQVGVLEIYKPTRRYVRAVTTRATANVVVDALLVKLYALAHRAPSMDATYPNYVTANTP